MQAKELETLKSVEELKKTLPPLFWGYEIRSFPKEYYDKNFVPMFNVKRLKAKKEPGRGFYKPISKF